MEKGILFYLLLANLYTFFMVWFDWYQEKKGKKEWLIPEWQMMTIGLCGGGLGGAVALIATGHKKGRRRVEIMFQLGIIIALILFAKMVGWI